MSAAESEAARAEGIEQGHVEAREGIAAAIRALTVSQVTLDHPYPVDAATAECARLAERWQPGEDGP